MRAIDSDDGCALARAVTRERGADAAAGARDQHNRLVELV